MGRLGLVVALNILQRRLNHQYQLAQTKGAANFIIIIISTLSSSLKLTGLAAKQHHCTRTKPQFHHLLHAGG